MRTRSSAELAGAGVAGDELGSLDVAGVDTRGSLSSVRAGEGVPSPSFIVEDRCIEPIHFPTAPRGAHSLKDDEDVALLHDVTGLDADLDDGARLLGDDGDLHLHRLEQDEFITCLDALADAHRDGVYVRDEVGCDVLCAHASIVAEARCYPRVRGVKPTRPFVEPVTGWVSPR